MCLVHFILAKFQSPGDSLFLDDTALIIADAMKCDLRSTFNFDARQIATHSLTVVEFYVTAHSSETFVIIRLMLKLRRPISSIAFRIKANALKYLDGGTL